VGGKTTDYTFYNKYKNLKMTKDITLTVSIDELALLLNKAFLKNPYKDILTKIIIGNLDTTSVGLNQLFKALNGIDNNIKWKIGMNVLVKENMLYSSSIDKAKMKENGMIHQGWFKAHIYNIDLYNSYPISIKFYVINNNEEKVEHTQTVSLDYITEGEEWPYEPISSF